jgi:hypothetical protein
MKARRHLIIDRSLQTTDFVTTPTSIVIDVELHAADAASIDAACLPRATTRHRRARTRVSSSSSSSAALAHVLDH